MIGSTKVGRENTNLKGAPKVENARKRGWEKKKLHYKENDESNTQLN